MFYVLFTYIKGQKERDFQRFRSEQGLINFLHENYEKIDIVQIIEAEKSFKLGLIETEDFVKSELVDQDIETDLPDPEEIDLSRKINVPIGPSAGKALSDKEILEQDKATLKKADGAIAVAQENIKKTEQRYDKTKWKDCPICHKEKVAPWSKKGIGTNCQRNKKKLRKKEE